MTTEPFREVEIGFEWVSEPIGFRTEEEISFTTMTRWQVIRWRIGMAIDVLRGRHSCEAEADADLAPYFTTWTD